MIDVKELRVGNKYMDSKGYIETVQQLMFYPLEKIDDLEPEYASPIPLTPEILESAGFERIVLQSNIKTDCFFKPFKNRYGKDCPFYIYANKNNDTGYFLSAEGFTTEILNVHQLQNLYFTLTNKELEINLTASIHESR